MSGNPFDEAGLGCFDFDGNPISMREWTTLRRDPRVRIAVEHVGGYMISTVWIGVWAHEGQPLIYETMVFDGDEPAVVRRYHSRREAEGGHREVVAQTKALVS